MEKIWGKIFFMINDSGDSCEPKDGAKNSKSGRNINYVNPETGTNTLWTNSNATKHMVTGNLVLILRLV